MVQANGIRSAARLATAKSPRSPVLMAGVVFISTAALMTLFEFAKMLVFPSITVWELPVIAIFLSGIVAAMTAFYVLRRFRLHEDAYRRLVEMSPEAVWVHRNGTIIIANRACATLFGTSSPKDFIGKHVLDFAHPRDHDAVRMRVQNQVDESNPIRQYEAKFVRWDGKDIDVEVVVCSILHQGAPASLVMFHDILERKQTGQKLRESEANLAAAQRIGHMGSWAMELHRLDDINQNVVRWSDELYRIFGYEAGQVESTRSNFLRFVHPEDRDSISRAMSKALAEGTGYSLEYRIIRPSGEIRFIKGDADQILDEQTKEPLRFVGTVQDITEQKQAEEKLAQLALIVESSDDAISSITPDGIISSWNKGAARIYGYTASEAIGRPITIISPPDRAEEIPRFWSASGEARKFKPWKLSGFERADGRLMCL